MAGSKTEVRVMISARVLALGVTTECALLCFTVYLASATHKRTRASPPVMVATPLVLVPSDLELVAEQGGQLFLRKRGRVGAQRVRSICRGRQCGILQARQCAPDRACVGLLLLVGRVEREWRGTSRVLVTMAVIIVQCNA